MSMQYEEGVSCFENGDYDKAVKWFREAAENGHPGAQYYLGRCYEEGLGVGRNTTTGNDWYKRAAEGGEERAIKALTHRTSKSTGKLSVKIPSEVSKSTNNTESVVPPWTRETDSNRKQIADEKPSFTPNIDLPSIMSPRHEEPYVIGPLPQGTSREALEAFRCVNHYIQYGSDLGAGYVQSEFMTLVDELIKMNNPSGAARYAKIYLEHFPSGTYANVMRYEILFYFR